MSDIGLEEDLDALYWAAQSYAKKILRKIWLILHWLMVCLARSEIITKELLISQNFDLFLKKLVAA